MNYKSGDLVKITGNCNYHNFTIGETVRLKEKDGSDWISESLEGGKHWWVRESDMTPTKATAMPQKIIITTDGKTTLARLFDGKTMVKRAEAKCAPSDVFDFGVGAELAVKRLMGEKPDILNPITEPVKLYCVKGDQGWLTKGKIYDSTSDFQVKYDNGFVGGPFSSIDEFHSFCPSTGAPLFPLVRRPAKVGEWVLVTDSAVDRFIGTVGKVERINSDGNPSVRHKKVWFDTHGDGTENTSMNGCKYLVLSGYTGDPA